jgi:hypothetical protein
MKALTKTALTLLAIVTLSAFTTIAAGYDWTQKICYGNHPGDGNMSNDRSAYRTYAAQPQVESRPAYSYVPAAPAVHVGDTIVVAAANASLKLSDRVVASVPQGHRIIVSSVEGPWVGTHIERNGRSVAGWILASDLATASIDRMARAGSPLK